MNRFIGVCTTTALGWVSIVSFGACAIAQCGEWRIDDGRLGAPGASVSTVWDPDGPGPEQPRLVVADVGLAGTAAGVGLATFDAVTRTWSSIDAPHNSRIYALAAMPNGDLIAAGDFFVIGGVFATSVARWNGTTWTPMGTGLDNRVEALAVMSNGDLIAGGYFGASGGTPMSHIARWNGTSWSPLGTGTNGIVLSLAATASGDLIAGGLFTQAGGVPASRVARWNGATWQALGAGVSGPVNALATRNGDVYCGGTFATAGGLAAGSVARWDGGAWHVLGVGVTGQTLEAVEAMALLPNGDLVVTGTFQQAGGSPAARVARWDGSAWWPLGSGLISSSFNTFVSGTAATVLPGGDLYVAGTFDRAGGVVVGNIARWDGTAWSRTDDGTDGDLYSMIPLAGGGFVAGGTFRTIGGVDTPCVARWDGATWSALGNGVGGLTAGDMVLDLVEMPNGDIIAGGAIAEVIAPGAIGSGHPVHRWDGSAWSALGPHFTGQVYAMDLLPNGHLVIGGSFQIPLNGGGVASSIAAWDGATWSSLGSSPNGQVWASVMMPNGDLAVGGYFTQIGGVNATGVARWNGSVWAPFGTGVTNTSMLAVLAGGDLVAGTQNGAVVQRWNGSTWQSLGLPGGGWLVSLLALPDGGLVATSYVNSQYAVQRWNGTSWSSLATGGIQFSATFPMATLLPEGGFALGASVVLPNHRGSAAMARFVSTCPATAVPAGVGCAGSGGVPSYAATALPWLGATYRTRGEGLPVSCFAIQVLGFGAAINVPLPASLLPAGAACRLFVAPDILQVQVASGVVEHSFAIPNSAPLLGTAFGDQLVALEIGAGGAIVQSSTSNALTATLGTF